MQRPAHSSNHPQRVAVTAATSTTTASPLQRTKEAHPPKQSFSSHSAMVVPPSPNGRATYKAGRSGAGSGPLSPSPTLILHDGAMMQSPKRPMPHTTNNTARTPTMRPPSLGPPSPSATVRASGVHAPHNGNLASPQRQPRLVSPQRPTTPSSSSGPVSHHHHHSESVGQRPPSLANVTPLVRPPHSTIVTGTKLIAVVTVGIKFCDVLLPSKPCTSRIPVLRCSIRNHKKK
jgi:hypothetical protein